MLLILVPLTAEIGLFLMALIGGGFDGVADVYEGFPRSHLADSSFHVNALLPALLCVASQVIFLLPVIQPARFCPGGHRSLRRGLVCAGFAASALLIGLFAALAEAFVQLSILDEEHMGSIMKTLLPDDMWFWPFFLATWLIWSPFIMWFTRKSLPRCGVERVLGLLLGGTVLEVLVVLPVDIVVRRRTDCYCGTGTFLALCMSIVACIWMAGPMVVLAVTSRRRRWWRDHHCHTCGSPAGPSSPARCPECGTERVRGRKVIAPGDRGDQ